MKKVFEICLTLIFISLQLSAQKTSDVIYLKNGSIIYGKLIEVNDSTYKMQTSDGSLFVYSSQEVEKYSIGVPSKRPLSKEQLDLALSKARGQINAGKALTFVGSGTTIIGIWTYTNGINDIGTGNHGTSRALTGLLTTVVGVGLMCAGLPNWLTGINKKNKIEIELVKFKSPETASINGIGIKIRF